MSPRGLDPAPTDAELMRRYEAQQANRSDVALVPPARPAIEPHAPRLTRRDAKRSQEEHHIQVALFEKVNDPAEQMKRPALAFVFAVPNGGYRTPRTAGRMKAEGVKPGPPDVWCPIARGGFYGLVIEMKKPGGTTSPEQAHWLSALAREGWKTALHTIDLAAWAELIAYLDAPPTVVQSPYPTAT